MKKNRIGLKVLLSAASMLLTVDQSSSMDYLTRCLTRAVESKDTSMVQFLLRKHGSEAASILPQIEHRNFLNQLTRQLVKAVGAGDEATVQSLLAIHGEEAASILSEIEHRYFLNQFKQQLVKAIASEDIATVRSLVVGHDADVSMLDAEGANLLKRIVFPALTGRPYSNQPSGRGIDFPESESRRILSELEGKRELIELLVENGAKFGGWFEFALSDLAELCDGADGYLGIIEFLLDCGANVNSVSWRGNPLLHTAVWLQNMELVEFLLARHADFRATGRRCRDTLLHIAAARRAKKSNGMFKNSNTSKLRFLNMAKKSEDLDMINLILGFHLDINAKNELDQTPLHVAVTTNNLSIVRCLLDNGAAPNVLNGKGETSLDVAVLYSREAIALLKEHGGKHSFELYFD